MPGKNSNTQVVEIYYITRSFHREELFCLSLKLKRAAISVPSNINEGAARNQKNEFTRALQISTG
jgi:four helix bundle protein